MLNMTAAGSYLRTLRKIRNLSQAELARRIGVTTNTIWRIEAGRQHPEGAVLAGILLQLNGSMRIFYDLVRSTMATESDGVRLAHSSHLEAIERPVESEDEDLIGFMEEVQQSREFLTTLRQALAVLRERGSSIS